MQEVERLPADANQWAKGTSGWGQKKNSESDVNWNQVQHRTTASDHTVASNVLQSSLQKAENTSELGGASKSGSVIASSGAANSSNQDKTQSSNKMASVSWGPSSSAVGLDSSLWSGLSSTSSANNSTWGSSAAPDNQGHKTQIGASSMADSLSSNGSASAGSWGLSPTSQNGASLPGSLTQSQANNASGNTSVLLSGCSNNQGIGSLGTSAMPWQNKSFGMRDFSQVSDASTSSPSIGSSSINKEGINTKAGTSTESGKMDIAAGLANLAIDKTAPPPGVGWKMKTGWNSSVDSQPVGGGNPADLSFARAAPTEKKPIVGGFKEGVMSAKEEEIHRAINSNEGWGTRPIRQDTAWDIESIAPKSSRKTSVDTSEMTPSTMWNDKGTDIWETSRANPGAWGGGAAGGGGVFAEKIPNSWNMPPKPNMSVGDWGGGRTSNPVMNVNNPTSDKTISTWGGESQQQSSSKLWGGATETGSWNEPPPEHNMAWNGQDTDVGTWEDPALQSANSRRIVSSSGIGPASMGGGGSGMNPGNNMGMGSGSMNMGSSNMSMGSGNMGMGNSNLGMGNPAMRMGGGSMGIGSGNGMVGNMNMPMPGNGGNMSMGNGSGMPGNMGMGGAANNMSMMMAGMNNMNITSNSGSGNGSDPSLYWNDPNPKSQGWNPGAGSPYPKAEEPWNRAGMGRSSGSSGWGEPVTSGQKADDGTSIWLENAQEQPRTSGWGDSSGVWNPAYGARPKSSPWVNGIDQENLQRRLGQRFSGSGGQPQMRIKLIQQLMDMGFRKEEAQSALISNNMNLESALGELTSGLHGKREMVNDVFQSGNEKIPGLMPDNSGIVCDDMPENRIDNNPHVPNFQMQNTPFSNTQVPNQSFTSTGMNMYDRSKAGPPMPPNSGGNMNNIQHKLKVLQQQQQQQGGTTSVFNSLSPSQVRGGAMPGNNTQSMVQQQAAQQQILQQLRLAVSSGLISPQLLNQQLPHNILVMLQQLLQLQNALQNLLQRQQFLQQNKVALNIPRTQLDQVSGMINQYRSQIQALQKQLQAAQQSLLIKQPPSVPTPSIQQMQSMMQQQPPMSMPPSISTSTPGDGGSESMSFHEDVAVPSGATNTTSMSRLNQWKQVSSDHVGQMDLNKAPGSKPQGQQYSHSTATMGPFGDLPSLNIGGDTTWSSSATGASNWPTTSGNGCSFDGKNENGTSATTGLASMLKESNHLGASTDVIPEFVPGQPWQGLSSKSVEDDPHITPGSVSRSLSVNVVKDDYLNNLTGNIKSSSVEASMANAVALGTANLQAQQNGGSSQWHGGTMDYSRQHSWAGRSSGSAFTQVSGSGWDSRQTPLWMLKNTAFQEEAQ